MNRRQQTILDHCYGKNGFIRGDQEIRFNAERVKYPTGWSPSWEYWQKGQLRDSCPGFMTPDSLIVKYFGEVQE